MMEFLKKLFSSIVFILDFIQKYFKLLLIALILVLIFGDSKGTQKQANLMRIDLYGAIFDSEEFLREVQKAESSNIKGVLVVVDSPGGAVAPSIEIAEAIKNLNEKKPVVVYGTNTMASGAYYSSIWANKIVANPGCIVGSIGVVFEGMNFGGLLDKMGIKPQVAKIGKYKETGTPFREWDEYERAELEKVANAIYNRFVNDVVKARNLDIKNQDKFADAHVFVADEAKSLGLIDEVGTIKYAQELLIKIAQIESPIWQEEDKFDKFFEDLMVKGVNLILNTHSGLKAY